VSSWKLQDPEPALAIRDCVSSTDATSWELIQALEQDGFVWRPWLNHAKRIKDGTPLGYKPGDAKHYYSSPASSLPICIFYLRALHSAEDCLSMFLILRRTQFRIPGVAWPHVLVVGFPAAPLPPQYQ
jgi:hypothetical protein